MATQLEQSLGDLRREVTDYLEVIAMGLFMRWNYRDLFLFFSPKKSDLSR